jgi:hypothetical protein
MLLSLVQFNAVHCRVATLSNLTCAEVKKAGGASVPNPVPFMSISKPDVFSNWTVLILTLDMGLWINSGFELMAPRVAANVAA